MNSLNLLTVSQSLLLTQDSLANLVNLPQGKDILQSVFGDRFELTTAISWLETETENNFSNFPTLEILTASEINDADGAYSFDTNTIYLATEFVSQNANHPSFISNVILEEFKHFLDAQLNQIDTPGEEEKLFTVLAQGKSLTNQELAKIKAEADRQTVVVNNQTVQIEQANLGDNSAFDLIGLTQLRNDPQFAGIDGSGLSVVVIDSGIDIDHPSIAPNYIAGYDFVDDDDDPSDFNGHGTHVSGTIGATDKTIGIAPEVDLISLRVLDSYGYGTWEDVEKSLEWVLENREKYNITAVNLSLGDGGFYSSESEALGDIYYGDIYSEISDNINRLEEAGVTIIAAAGNYYDWYEHSGIIFPAISSTLAVGATPSDSDSISYFSQRLDAPNLVFAPGETINSTLIGEEIGGEEYNGTSMASPHVAGAVALLQETSLQYNGRSLTTDEVVDILSSTADLIVDEEDLYDGVTNTGDTYRRINVYNAVAAVKSPSDDTSGATVHRFFRSDIGSHFYTASEDEKDAIIANLPNYSYEGESYVAATVTTDSLTGAKPVYRFFNNNTGAHLYTISEVERDSINSNLPNYDYEGVAYYGYESDLPGTTPLYRFYNPEIDAHFYTPSEVEKEAILANLPDYQLESNDGVAFYVETITEI